MTDPIRWIAGQLEGRAEPEKPRHCNPRPAGEIRPGSGTDVLLRYLRQHCARWFLHHELVLALGRSKGEIDWALQYLTKLELLRSEEFEQPGRKPVLRYQLKSQA